MAIELANDIATLPYTDTVSNLTSPGTCGALSSRLYKLGFGQWLKLARTPDLYNNARYAGVGPVGAS